MSRKFGALACCRKGDSLPSIFYFDAAGRAEAARFCFLLGGVEFKDVRFPKDSTWLSYWKQRSPTGKAPWMEVDGTKIAESRAIVMYAAKRGNLVPSKPEHVIHGEMVLDLIEKVIDEGVAYTVAQGIADKQAGMKAFIEAYIKEGKLLSLERAITKHQSEEGFTVGGALSYVDAYVATYVSIFASVASEESGRTFAASYPGMHKVKQLIYGMDVIKNYLVKYPSSVVLETSRQSCETKVISLVLEAAGINFTVSAPVEESTTHTAAPVLVLNNATRVEGMEAVLEWINNRYSVLPLDTKRTTVVWELLQSVRDICAKYHQWDEGKASEVATMIDNVDSRLRDLHITEGGSESLTIADFAAAVLYEVLSLNNKSMKFTSSLETLAQAYNRVYLIKSVRLSHLKRNRPALYYFPVPAKAESCRFMFHVAEIPFDDVRFTFEEFGAKYKAMSPTGQCPFLKLGDDIIPESLAITRMIGEASGFAPFTSRGKILADSMAAAYQRCMTVSDRSYLLKAEEQLAFRKEHLPPAMDVWEKVVAQFKCKGDWAVENRLTWVDVYIAAEYQMWNVFYKAIDIDGERWPTLTSIYHKVMALPAIQQYKASGC